MSRSSDFDLVAEEIVSAAIEIFREEGLDAVSMRSVVVPTRRVAGAAVQQGGQQGGAGRCDRRPATRRSVPGERRRPALDRFAARWAADLRTRLHQAHDSRLILSLERDAYVEASRPRRRDAQRGTPG